jgi:hypothetical protein
MPKYVRLPDGTLFPAKDNESPLEVISAAIKKYPEIFYVKDASKCGVEPHFIALQVKDEYFACGFEAHIQLISKNGISTAAVTPQKPVNNGKTLNDISLASVAIPVLAASIIGFGLSWYFTRGFRKFYKSKIQSILVATLMITIGIGLTGIGNELINSQLNGLNIKIEKIFQFAVANLLVFPLLIWGLLKLTNKNNVSNGTIEKEYSKDSSAIGQKSSEIKDENFATRSPPDSKISVPNNQIEKSIAASVQMHELSDEEVNTLYATALDEIESDKKDKGVWAKSFALSRGDARTTEARYIEERFLILKAKAIQDATSNIHTESEDKAN